SGNLYSATTDTDISKVILPDPDSSAEITINGSAENLIKLSWIYFDQKYYADFPNSYTNSELNAAKAELSLKYVNYLEDGGDPFISSIAKIAGTDEDHLTRKQSLHDNLL